MKIRWRKLTQDEYFKRWPSAAYGPVFHGHKQHKDAEPYVLEFTDPENGQDWWEEVQNIG